MTTLLLVALLVGLPAPDFSSRHVSDFRRHWPGKFLHVTPQPPNAKPRFQTLPKPAIATVLIQGNWQLDGLNCVGCRLRNAVLRYSGGPFRCSECWIEETLTIIISGAALNTSAVKDWLDRIRHGAGDAATIPLPTFTETVHLKRPLKVNLLSPSVSP